MKFAKKSRHCPSQAMTNYTFHHKKPAKMAGSQSNEAIYLNISTLTKTFIAIFHPYYCIKLGQIKTYLAISTKAFTAACWLASDNAGLVATIRFALAEFAATTASVCNTTGR